MEMPIDKESGHDAKAQEPRLILTSWVKGEDFAYECSRCSQLFLLPEDQTPKEGAAELLAAFREHVSAEHREIAERTTGSGDDGSGRT
jgi:hypothetical protein